jgi:hypothetical protein
MMPSRYTDDLLDAMRLTTDAPADRAVDDLFHTGSVSAVNGLMIHLVRNDQPIPDQLPACIQDYLAHQSGLPSWADPVRIQRAEEFFSRHGVCATMILSCASLPECYAAAKGVQVLHMTARLATDPTRRIAETGQMVLQVMAPGGLSPNGDGVRIAQKVRLMHAAVRQLILSSGQWDEAWGRPINQEDMAGTLMTFSWTMLDAMRKLGVSIAAEDADAYIHAWNVVGHLLGVRDELLPADSTEAEALITAVRRRQFAPSAAGRELAGALVELLHREIPLFRDLPEALIRHFLGDEVGDILGLANAPPERIISCCEAILGAVEREEDHSSLLAAISAPFSHAVLEAFATLERGGMRAPFAIPLALRQSWGVAAGS